MSSSSMVFEGQYNRLRKMHVMFTLNMALYNVEEDVVRAGVGDGGCE